MRHAVTVPGELLPKPEPYRNCECMKEPIDLEANKGIVVWLRKAGDMVQKGEVICEGEVAKKTVEFQAPCSGILAEITVEDEYVFKAGTILGYIEEAR
jgi:predicted deacylase